MGVIVPNFASSTEDRASGAQVIDGGLRFDSGKSHYLSRTPASAGNRKTWTWAGWVKRSGSYKFLFDVYTGVNNDSGWNGILFSTNNTIRFQGWFTIYAETNAVYRDTSAWYHVVVALDSTQATSSDRIKIYINGTEQSLAISNVTLNQDYIINTNSPHTLGSDRGVSSYFDGSLTNTYLIDGQALGPEYFGYTDPLTNTWRPKKFKPQATPNNGTTWSNYLTSSTGSFYPGNGPTNLFDGNLSTNCDASTSSGSVTFTPPSIIRFSGDLRVYQSVSGVDFELTDENDVTTTISKSSAASWATVKSGGGTLKSLKCTPTSNNYCNWRAIEIDGVTLLDTDTTNMGVNAFYLPFDGSAPIGQDQSGRGNDWTPVNFGGSNTIEKATGALPILNTDGGGKVARPGTRTDANASYIVLALPLVGIKSDFSNQINSGSTTKTITSVNAVASYTQSNFYGGSYAFDGSGDALTSTTSGLAPGTSDFCCEGWFYYNAQPSTSAYRLLGNVNSVANTTDWQLIQQTNGNLTIWSGSANTSIGTSPIPTASWTHIAYVRDGATHKVYINGVQMSSTVTRTGHNLTYNGLDIGGRNDGAECINGYIQDVRFYIGTTKYTSNFIPASTNPDVLPDSPSGVSYSSNLDKVIGGGSCSFTGGNNGSDISWTGTIAATHTVDMYVYGSGVQTAGASPLILSDGTDGYQLDSDGSTYSIRLEKAGGGSSTGFVPIIPGWNHIRIVVSGATANLYINGVANGSCTVAGGTIGPSTFYIGTKGRAASTVWWTGFICNVRIIEAALTGTASPVIDENGIIASSEGGNDAIFLWPGVTSTTQNLGTDGDTITATAGPTLSDFNPFTTNINTVRGQESGYATLNPLRCLSAITLSNGNLNLAYASASTGHVSATVGVSTGKWYWEYTPSSEGNMIGISDEILLPTQYIGQTSTTWGYFGRDSHIYNNGSTTTYGTTWGAGDTVGVAFDATNRNLSFYKNGVYLGIAASGISAGVYYPAFSRGSNTPYGNANFGQNPFKFPPPEGFQPLNVANVRPSTVIARPDQYVGVTTYTGNGGTQSLNVGFKPDFVWIKNRNITGYWNELFDSVRGVSRRLFSNDTSTEDFRTGQGLTSFNDDGFSLTYVDANDNGNNSSGNTFVAWAWKAGGNSNTFNIDGVGYDTASAAGLDGGSITPIAASVGTKQGFSIIQYQGNGSTDQSISHGLTQAPDFSIFKNMDGASNWTVFHRSVTTTTQKVFYLNTTGGIADYSGGDSTWWYQLPGSSLFYIGATSTAINNGTNDIISYHWHSVPGFSKFGSYIGNGLADGPMIVTGFRPRWILTKRTDTTASWILHDTERSKFNPTQIQLYPNLANKEDIFSPNARDVLSNGFKLRGDDAFTNASNGTYIYAAFAESPTFNLYGAQANAR